MKRLLTGLMLCGILLAAGCAAAQNSNYTSLIQDIGKAPSVSFALPPDAALYAKENNAQSYGDGWDMSTTLQLSSGNIYVHLLYPSAPITSRLSRAEIRSVLETFRPEMAGAGYYDSPLNISGRSAVSGELQLQSGNQTFIAYQPGIRTVAVIFFDEGLAQDAESSFLRTLYIQTNEDASAHQSAMPQALAPEAALPQAIASPAASSPVAASPATAPQIPLVMGEPFSNPSSSHLDQIMNDKGPGANSRADNLSVSMERMAADRNAATERLGLAKENLGP